MKSKRPLIIGLVVLAVLLGAMLIANALRRTIRPLRRSLIPSSVLAGFLVAIPKEFVEAYPNRIINIHPALIPAFCGKGMYGLHVHEAVLARGVKVTGATVHFVDEGTDTGPILLQRAVAVRQDDTPESLQLRVMRDAEWELLPRAIDLIARGLVQIVDGRVIITGDIE